jgi:hypothetical protein
MKDEWAGMRWSEEQERVRVELRALRVLTCPRRACRRHRKCGRKSEPSRPCLGDARFPVTEEEYEDYKAMIMRWLKRDVAEYDADPEAAEIVQAERLQREAEREAAAMERIYARLMAGETPEEIFEGLDGEPAPATKTVSEAAGVRMAGTRGDAAV